MASTAWLLVGLAALSPAARAGTLTSLNFVAGARVAADPRVSPWAPSLSPALAQSGGLGGLRALEPENPADQGAFVPLVAALDGLGQTPDTFAALSREDQVRLLAMGFSAAAPSAAGAVEKLAAALESPETHAEAAYTGAIKLLRAYAVYGAYLDAPLVERVGAALAEAARRQGEARRAKALALLESNLPALRGPGWENALVAMEERAADAEPPSAAPAAVVPLFGRAKPAPAKAPAPKAPQPALAPVQNPDAYLWGLMHGLTEEEARRIPAWTPKDELYTRWERASQAAQRVARGRHAAAPHALFGDARSSAAPGKESWQFRYYLVAAPHARRGGAIVSKFKPEANPGKLKARFSRPKEEEVDPNWALFDLKTGLPSRTHLAFTLDEARRIAASELPQDAVIGHDVVLRVREEYVEGEQDFWYHFYGARQELARVNARTGRLIRRAELETRAASLDGKLEWAYERLIPPEPRRGATIGEALRASEPKTWARITGLLQIRTVGWTFAGAVAAGLLAWSFWPTLGLMAAWYGFTSYLGLLAARAPALLAGGRILVEPSLSREALLEALKEPLERWLKKR